MDKINKREECSNTTGEIQLIEPSKWLCPICVDVPHTGSAFPYKWIASSKADKNCYDFGIDKLTDNISQFGFPVLRSFFHRAYIDVNRSLYDLNPEDISGVLPIKNNSKALKGNGLIWSHNLKGQKLFENKLSTAEINNRINKVWQPYHNRLKAMLSAMHDIFRVSLHLNIHSMSSSSVSGVNPNIDIVIGDKNHTSSESLISQVVMKAFKETGFVVAYNVPFPGDELLAYSTPKTGINSIQIEINRNCFWNDRRMQPSLEYVKTKKRFECAINDIALELLKLNIKKGSNHILEVRNHYKSLLNTAFSRKSKIDSIKPFFE